MKKILFFSLIVLVGIIALIVPIGQDFGFIKNNLYTDQSNLLFQNQNFVKPKEEIALIVVGDIMLSRGVAKKIEKNGNDYPFLKVKDYLKTGDIVFGNLETPISSGREILPGEMFFRSEPGMEKELSENNFSILSLANNHTGNFGDYGLEQTFKYLNQAGIKYVGAGENEQEAYAPTYIDIQGFKFAFLAYDDIDFTPVEYGATEKSAGLAFMNKDKLVAGIIEAKQKADFVIISMHSGNEYQDYSSEKQKEFAHLAIDSGAELVIGHHPHVVQEIEKYKNKYIFYSLGNFIFDQMWSTETRQGAIVKFWFNREGLKDFEIKIVKIEDYAQPNIIDSPEAEAVLQRMGVKKIK